MKAVYGADVLAGAAYYNRKGKPGTPFFSGNFCRRAGAYYNKYGYETTRKAMAKWYEQSILNARKNPKAQEFHNTKENLFELGMTPPDPKRFVPFLNPYDCSKVTDGASSLVILRRGIKKMRDPERTSCRNYRHRSLGRGYHQAARRVTSLQTQR